MQGVTGLIGHDSNGVPLAVFGEPELCQQFRKPLPIREWETKEGLEIPNKHAGLTENVTQWNRERDAVEQRL